MSNHYHHWILPRSRDLVPSADRVVELVRALRAERWVLTTGNPTFEALAERRRPHFAGLAKTFSRVRARRGEAPAPGHDRTSATRPDDDDEPMHSSQNHAVQIPQVPDSDWLRSLLRSNHPCPLAREVALSFDVELDEAVTMDWDEATLEYPFTFGDDDPTNRHEINVFMTDDFATHDWGNTFSRIDDRCSCGTSLGYDPRERYPEYRAALLPYHRIARTCPRCGAAFDPTTRVAETTDWGWSKKVSRGQLRGGVTFRFAVFIDCENAYPHGDRFGLRPEFRKLVEEAIGEPFEDIGGFE